MRCKTNFYHHQYIFYCYMRNFHLMKTMNYVIWCWARLIDHPIFFTVHQFIPHKNAGKNPRFFSFFTHQFKQEFGSKKFSLLHLNSGLELFQFIHSSTQSSLLSSSWLCMPIKRGKNYQDAFVCHYSFRNWYSNPVWLNNNKMNGKWKGDSRYDKEKDRNFYAYQ